MGGISDLVAALSILGIIWKRDAREEERKFRQEEVFVPFNLPPLPQRIVINSQEETIKDRKITHRLDLAYPPVSHAQGCL